MKRKKKLFFFSFFHSASKVITYSMQYARTYSTWNTTYIRNMDSRILDVRRFLNICIILLRLFIFSPRFHYPANKFNFFHDSSSLFLFLLLLPLLILRLYGPRLSFVSLSFSSPSSSFDRLSFHPETPYDKFRFNHHRSDEKWKCFKLQLFYCCACNRTLDSILHYFFSLSVGSLTLTESQMKRLRLHLTSTAFYTLRLLVFLLIHIEIEAACNRFPK